MRYQVPKASTGELEALHQPENAEAMGLAATAHSAMATNDFTAATKGGSLAEFNDIIATADRADDHRRIAARVSRQLEGLTAEGSGFKHPFGLSSSPKGGYSVS